MYNPINLKFNSIWAQLQGGAGQLQGGAGRPGETRAWVLPEEDIHNVWETYFINT